MTDIVKTIMDGLQNEPNVNPAKIGLEVKKAKGLFNRRRVVHVFGSVDSDLARQKIVKLVEKQIGDRYDLADELKVKEKAR